MPNTYDSGKTQRVAIQERYTDPFAGFPLNTSTQNARNLVYISGSLDVFTLKSGITGQWIMLGDVWYRLLNAQAFLWLRDRVTAAIESSGQTESLLGAVEALEAIRRAGIDHQSFSSSDVDEWQRASSEFSWWDDCPRWVESY